MYAIRSYYGIDFIAGTVSRIDAEGNRLELANGKSVNYDYLIITTGPKLRITSYNVCYTKLYESGRLAV